jgi:hypothetical protein
MRYMTLIFAALLSSVSIAGVLPGSARDELLRNALSQFWGRARISDGSVVQPENEEERNILPISKDAANQVIDIA